MKRYLIPLAFIASLFVVPAQAQNSTVAAMTAASALGGTELLYCVQSGADRKCTPAQIATYLQATSLTLSGANFNILQTGSSCPNALTTICFQTPNTNTFGMEWFDASGNLTRTFDQTTGRMDARANSAAGSSQGAAIGVGFNNASPANNDILGHYFWRGNDTVNGNTNQDTFAYIQGVATNVSGSGSNLNSALKPCVMKNQTAGAGNAQPNFCVTFDGSSSAFTFDNTITITAVAGNVSLGSAGIPVRVAQNIVSNKASNYGVAASDCGTIFSTITAAGEVDFTLPSAPTGSGCSLTFMVNANQTIKVIANTGQIIRCGGSVSTTAGNYSSLTQGNSISIVWLNSATSWIATSATGSGGSTGCGGWTGA